MIRMFMPACFGWYSNPKADSKPAEPGIQHTTHPSPAGKEVVKRRENL